MMLRASLAAALILGGSLTAALAATDAAPAAAEAGAASEDAALPRFEPSAAEFAEVSASFDTAGAAAAGPLGEVAEDLGTGVASWYGARFAGRRTASGERFDPDEYTAAHRTLPFGSRVRVTRGDRSVVVRINDRGPFHGNRVIDLSRAAADELGLIRAGRAEVELALLN